jgi:hypothetical protein
MNFLPSCVLQPNGSRYPLVGGRRQRRFAGTSLEPEKCLKTRRVPASRVHAVLAVFIPKLNSIINISHGKIDVGVEMFLPKNASRKIGRLVFNKYSFIALGLRPLNGSLQEGFPDSPTADIWPCISRFNLSGIGVLKQETFSIDS